MGRFAAGIWAEPFWQFYVSWPKISSFTKLACWDGPFLCGNAKALVVCARNVWSDYTSFLGGVKLDLEFHYKKDIRSCVFATNATFTYLYPSRFARQLNLFWSILCWCDHLQTPQWKFIQTVPIWNFQMVWSDQTGGAGCNRGKMKV